MLNGIAPGFPPFLGGYLPVSPGASVPTPIPAPSLPQSYCAYGASDFFYAHFRSIIRALIHTVLYINFYSLEKEQLIEFVQVLQQVFVLACQGAGQN
jgi:hypothetical protein